MERGFVFTVYFHIHVIWSFLRTVSTPTCQTATARSSHLSTSHGRDPHFLYYNIICRVNRASLRDHVYFTLTPAPHVVISWSGVLTRVCVVMRYEWGVLDMCLGCGWVMYQLIALHRTVFMHIYTFHQPLRQTLCYIKIWEMVELTVINGMVDTSSCYTRINIILHFMAICSLI